MQRREVNGLGPLRLRPHVQVFTALLVAPTLYAGQVSNGIDFGDGARGAAASAAPRPADVQQLVRALKGGAKGRKKWNEHERQARALMAAAGIEGEPRSLPGDTIAR